MRFFYLFALGAALLSSPLCIAMPAVPPHQTERQFAGTCHPPFCLFVEMATSYVHDLTASSQASATFSLATHASLTPSISMSNIVVRVTEATKVIDTEGSPKMLKRDISGSATIPVSTSVSTARQTQGVTTNSETITAAPQTSTLDAMASITSFDTL